MTLLTMANAVADESKGPRPATIAGNTSVEARQILRLINKVGIRLMKIYPWQILRFEKAFTAPGVETILSAANMPSDFNRFIPETFWDKDTNNLISGPIKPVEWNGLKTQTYASQNKKFIFRAGAILTVPVFDAGVNVAFEYVGENWVGSDVTEDLSSPAASMTADTDITYLNEELIIAVTKYEYLKDEGQPWLQAAKDARDALDTECGNDAKTTKITVAGDIFARNTRHHQGAPQPSRAAYGADF